MKRTALARRTPMARTSAPASKTNRDELIRLARIGQAEEARRG